MPISTPAILKLMFFFSLQLLVHFCLCLCCYSNHSHYTKMFIIHVYARRAWPMRMVEVCLNTLHIRQQSKVFFFSSFDVNCVCFFWCKLLTFSTVYYFRKINEHCLCVTSSQRLVTYKMSVSTMKVILKQSAFISKGWDTLK